MNRHPAFDEGVRYGLLLVVHEQHVENAQPGDYPDHDWETCPLCQDLRRFDETELDPNPLTRREPTC